MDGGLDKSDEIDSRYFSDHVFLKVCRPESVWLGELAVKPQNVLTCTSDML